MNEHYIELVTWNKKMMLLYGDKLTGTQRAIGWRSNGLHTEIHFSPDYGGIWWSCTTADGADGCRFKMINRSHPYRQSVVRIYVTKEQEARLFAKCCEMADVDSMWYDAQNDSGFGFEGLILYGPNHIKYDRWGARLAFILKWEWWKMHRVKMICNEAVANVMLVVWPDLLDISRETRDELILEQLDPATLTPDQFHYLVEYYFQQQDRPNQTDIDNIIKEVNGE